MRALDGPRLKTHLVNPPHCRRAQCEGDGFCSTSRMVGVPQWRFGRWCEAGIGAEPTSKAVPREAGIFMDCCFARIPGWSQPLGSLPTGC
jgi:hypothetical protein